MSGHVLLIFVKKSAYRHLQLMATEAQRREGGLRRDCKPCIKTRHLKPETCTPLEYCRPFGPMLVVLVDFHTLSTYTALLSISKTNQWSTSRCMRAAPPGMPSHMFPVVPPMANAPHSHSQTPWHYLGCSTCFCLDSSRGQTCCAPIQWPRGRLTSTEEATLLSSRA